MSILGVALGIISIAFALIFSKIVRLWNAQGTGMVTQRKMLQGS